MRLGCLGWVRKHPREEAKPALPAGSEPIPPKQKYRGEIIAFGVRRRGIELERRVDGRLLMLGGFVCHWAGLPEAALALLGAYLAAFFSTVVLWVALAVALALRALVERARSPRPWG